MYEDVSAVTKVSGYMTSLCQSHDIEEGMENESGASLVFRVNEEFSICEHSCR